MPEAFIKKFQNFSFHNELYKKGGKIIIALSGGPDSTALALIYSRLEKKYNLKLLAIHINYDLRGKDSEADEKFVKKLTGKLGIKLKVFRYKKPKKVTGNLEENLRNFRYDVFEDQRKKNRFDVIAVAHTLDDQAETFFINLLRGAGSDGLSGLKARRGTIIRPLLFAEKKEIINFLKKNNQKSRIDKSNFDPSFTRNRIRIKLIPYLEKNYNPKIKQIVSATTGLLSQQNELIEKIVEKEFQAISKKKNEAIIFSKKGLKKQDEFLLKKIFRKAIVEVTGDTKNITSAHFFEFEKALLSIKPKRKNLKIGKIHIEINEDEVSFGKIKN